MSYEVAVETGYGFMFGKDQFSVFTSLFGLDPDGYDEWVGAQLPTPEGFPDSVELVLLGRNDPVVPSGPWAIVVLSSLSSFEPAQHTGVWELKGKTLDESTEETLVALRDKFFPPTPGEPDIRPSVGWLLMASIF